MEANKQNLSQLLQYRRAVRLYNDKQVIDSERVRYCLELAQLAPTSSNMQLWEAYHITQPELLAELAEACLSQQTATTAQEMVIFVTRPDKAKEHAKANLDFEIENIRRNSPADRVNPRIEQMKTYYTKVVPLLYSRVWGLGRVRQLLSWCIGLFRPIVREVSRSDMRVSIHKSCALAIQTFMLAMAEQGYDTCPVEGYDSRRIRKALGLPSAAEISMVITCGIRRESGVRGERFRLAFAEQYHRC